jgi:hypothetical protein
MLLASAHREKHSVKQYLLMYRRPDSRTHEFMTVAATSEAQARQIGTEIERDHGLDLEFRKAMLLKTGDLPG